MSTRSKEMGASSSAATTYVVKADSVTQKNTAVNIRIYLGHIHPSVASEEIAIPVVREGT